jgi:SAM-dependent methyltransferase
MRQLQPPPYLNMPLPKVDLAVADGDKMYLDSDAHYLSVGLSALEVIERALGGAEPSRILDLPSGFGRVTRFLRARYPRAAITATDLDRDGVDFCATRFGARAAYSVRDFCELRLGETYDMIWVGSLITHLPALQTGQFFEAMARHMTPCSTLVVSLHGPSIIPRLLDSGYGLQPAEAAAVVAEYEQTGFGYRDYAGGGDEEYGVALSNEHYGISLIGEAWLRDALPRWGLRLDDYAVRAWDDHHDVAVARLRDAPPPPRTSAGRFGRRMLRALLRR